MFHGMDYMYAVYEEKSFSKAAKRLFISQPSLSATVRRIEEQLGYPVFDRSSKPLKLTEFGKEYIHMVEKMRALQTEFTDFVNDWEGLHTGQLILGGSSLFSSWVLPPLMGAFSHKFPLIHLELKEETTVELASLLQNGAIDLMLDNCDLDELIFDRCLYQKEHLLLAVPKNLAVNQMLQDYQIPVSAIRSGTFLDRSYASVPLEAFHDQTFIMLKLENDTGKRAFTILKTFHLHPRILFELDQQMTSFNVTCSGLGISFISDTLISQVPFADNVIYYKLPENYSERNIYFYWKHGRYFSRAMKEFLKMNSHYSLVLPSKPC